MKEKFFVYILQSMKDFSFYIGQCDDLDKRMSKHFDGMGKYAASKRPLRLVYFELYETRSEAIRTISFFEPGSTQYSKDFSPPLSLSF